MEARSPQGDAVSRLSNRASLQRWSLSLYLMPVIPCGAAHGKHTKPVLCGLDWLPVHFHEGDLTINTC